MKHVPILATFSVLATVITTPVRAAHPDDVRQLLETNECIVCDLIQVDLRGQNLANANVSGSNFSFSNIANANLAGADLSGSNLGDVDLSAANLTMANLIGANLSNANLTGVDLGTANLSNATLIGANLTNADLTGANLSDVKLGGARLTNVSLIGANLSNADLSGADLRAANLSNTNLTGANLSKASLNDANLSNATLTGVIGLSQKAIAAATSDTIVSKPLVTEPIVVKALPSESDEVTPAQAEPLEIDATTTAPEQPVNPVSTPTASERSLIELLRAEKTSELAALKKSETSLNVSAEKDTRVDLEAPSKDFTVTDTQLQLSVGAIAEDESQYRNFLRKSALQYAYSDMSLEAMSQASNTTPAIEDNSSDNLVSATNNGTVNNVTPAIKDPVVSKPLPPPPIVSAFPAKPTEAVAAQTELPQLDTDVAAQEQPLTLVTTPTSTAQSLAELFKSNTLDTSDAEIKDFSVTDTQLQLRVSGIGEDEVQYRNFIKNASFQQAYGDVSLQAKNQVDNPTSPNPEDVVSPSSAQPPEVVAAQTALPQPDTAITAQEQPLISVVTPTSTARSLAGLFRLDPSTFQQSELVSQAGFNSLPTLTNSDNFARSNAANIDFAATDTLQIAVAGAENDNAQYRNFVQKSSAAEFIYGGDASVEANYQMYNQ